MTNQDINRRFAELVGLCWHEWVASYSQRICKHCGYRVSASDYGPANPDFISDPRLVLREMMKRKDFLEFSRDKLDCPWEDDRVYWNYVHTDYILDTTGLLAMAAIEWLEKEEEARG